MATPLPWCWAPGRQASDETRLLSVPGSVRSGAPLLFLWRFLEGWGLSSCFVVLLDHGNCCKNECHSDDIFPLCAQSCPALCHPGGCSLPGSSVHGIFRQEYWSGFLFPTPGDLPDLGIEPVSLSSPGLAGRCYTTVPPGKPAFSL